MAFSKAAAKLLAYFGLYKITATEYNTRIGGTQDNYYNANWFVHGLNSEGRKRASDQKGAFKTALAELVAGGY